MENEFNWRMELRRALKEYFPEPELKTLCSDLYVVYDDLQGETRPEKIISLIDYFDDRGEIDRLIAYCSRVRQNVPWDEIKAAAVADAKSGRLTRPFTNPNRTYRLEINSQTIAVAGVVLLAIIMSAYFAFRPNRADTTTAQAKEAPIAQLTPEPAATIITLVVTATPEATPTPTDTPPTPTAAATATTEPTEAPPTPTSEPTTAPTQEPTAAPTLAPTEEVSAQIEPTVVYPDGLRLELHYDPNSFYLYNPAASRIRVRDISFEALDSNERPLPYAMSATLWTAVYSFLDGRSCYAIEPFGADGPFMNPAFCLQENAREAPNINNNIVFWTERSGSVVFRVLWAGEEIARCPLGTGSCEIYIPAP